ncbi:MAG: hypothetical protein K2O03_06250, partial [Lachnospiraceae bacterium]|nr:hypothetical protein [Lachnospiraceae bacterium]
DKRVLSCLDNYRIHLIAPAQMEDSEIMKLQSNLREVLLFIKYSKDKDNLNRILESGKVRFGELERRAVDVIQVITGMGLKYDESEVKVDMCQAIAEMRAEERQLGREEGREEGRREIHQAMQESQQEAARNFYRMGLDIETISLGLNVSAETIRQWINQPSDEGK